MENINQKNLNQDYVKVNPVLEFIDMKRCVCRILNRHWMKSPSEDTSGFEADGIRKQMKESMDFSSWNTMI